MKPTYTSFILNLATMWFTVFIAPSARADLAENAFVKIRATGADVTRVDGRNFSAQGNTEVEITAQPGWTLLTPSRIWVTATASLDPENPDVKKVTWGGVNNCNREELFHV